MSGTAIPHLQATLGQGYSSLGRALRSLRRRGYVRTIGYCHFPEKRQAFKEQWGEHKKMRTAGWKGWATYWR